MKVKNLSIPLPKDKYIAHFEVNDHDVQVVFKKKQKIALLFIALNHQYWPYLKQVIEDARKHFLPHHNVDFYVWTDIPDEDTPEFKDFMAKIPSSEDVQIMRDFAKTMDDLQQVEKVVSREKLQETVNFIREAKDIKRTFTEPLPEHRYCTLMRYHLFLQKEEELKKYDHLFYLDVDMRIVSKISDEVLSEGLLAAEHPMYSLKKQYYPPYEPNEQSTAYIPRPGKIIDDEGKPRFQPYYYAGGFQGGTSKEFIKAMKVMKENIDVDFNKNYTAVWNDESHWNRFLFDYKGKTIVLSPAYIYPDSLIKDYYEPLWGRSYEPKIITITKPWMLSKEAGIALRKQLGHKVDYQPVLIPNKIQCEKCFDILQYPGHHIQKVISCAGSGKPHELSMIKV